MRDMFSLEGKTAVVTGGSGLIGWGVVGALREFGARVYVADPDGEKVAALGDPDVRHLPLDIADEMSVESMLDTALADAGSLDVLVNAAYPRTADWGAPVAEVSGESFDANLAMHLGGYFLAARGAAERMKARAGGSIVNLASIYGLVGPDMSLYEGTEMGNAVAYSAIKGGIIAMTRYLATAYGSAGVRANSISPGGVFDNQSEPFLSRYTAKVPLGRMAEPRDVAGAVIYLASDASSYVTGHNLVVDGGWTAW